MRPESGWPKLGCRRDWPGSQSCTLWWPSTPRQTGRICRPNKSPRRWWSGSRPIAVRGVQALLVAGYQVYAINPMSSARYRERHSTSGAKSDAGDAHVLAEIVRVDRNHHAQIAGDSQLAGAVKLLARAHQTAIWERTRQILRLRSTLLQFFPAAVEAFPDLAGKDSLILLARAPSPARATKLTRSQVVSALRAARRHHAEGQGRRVAELVAPRELAANSDRCGGICGDRVQPDRRDQRIEH